MKVLVTGVKGQLGYDVMNELAKRGYEGVGVDVEEMDITDSAAGFGADMWRGLQSKTADLCARPCIRISRAKTSRKSPFAAT